MANKTAVQKRVAQFLASKGLSPQAIAGVMGNLSVESGFNTSAHNPREGAIGLVQWEGGRRTKLQHYASQHGGKETDLEMQLGYMWHELEHSYKHVIRGLQSAKSPQAAAALWDSKYEISAGTTRGARVRAAQKWYGNGGARIKGLSGGAAVAVGDTAAAGATQKVNYQALTSIGGLVSTVPELKKLLAQAQSQSWTLDKFQNSIQNTKWWKQHSNTARSALASSVNDPATYRQNQKNLSNHIFNVAKQMGVRLDGKGLASLVSAATLQGLNDEGISSTLAQMYADKAGTASATGQGQAADYRNQIASLANDYGVPMADVSLNKWTQNALVTGSLAGAQTYLVNAAKSTYAGIKDQIDENTSVRQLAGTYIDSMAQTLELDPEAIKLTDPTIQKALVGQPEAAKPGDKTTGTTPAAIPLWQFNQSLRSDPRWDRTANAKQSAYTMLHDLGKSFGFAS